MFDDETNGVPSSNRANQLHTFTKEENEQLRKMVQEKNQEKMSAVTKLTKSQPNSEAPERPNYEKGEGFMLTNVPYAGMDLDEKLKNKVK